MNTIFGVVKYYVRGPELIRTPVCGTSKLVYTRGKLGVLGKLEIREQQKMPEPELQKINTFVLLQNTQNV